MIGWLVVVAVNAMLIAWAVRARRRPQPRGALRRVVSACVTLLFLAGAAGVIWGLGRAIAAVSSPSLDAAQRARVLAEGISETMNCMAFGLALLLLPTLFAVALLVRAPKEGQANDAAPR
jgi:hypothetical protein